MESSCRRQLREAARHGHAFAKHPDGVAGASAHPSDGERRRSSFSSRGRFFAGLIDEPKVYDKTLTSNEAATFSFIKEGDEVEAASHSTVVYSTFNEIAADAAAVVTVKDLAQNSMTMKVHYCDVVTVDMMPYGACLPFPSAPPPLVLVLVALADQSVCSFGDSPCAATAVNACNRLALPAVNPRLYPTRCPSTQHAGDRHVHARRSSFQRPLHPTAAVLSSRTKVVCFQGSDTLRICYQFALQALKRAFVAERCVV